MYILYNQLQYLWPKCNNNSVNYSYDTVVWHDVDNTWYAQKLNVNLELRHSMQSEIPLLNSVIRLCDCELHMANKNDYTVTWMMKPQWTLNNVRFSLQQIKQILNKQLQKYYKNRAALWTPLKFTSHGNIKILNLIEKLKCCNFNHTRTLPIFSQGPITFWEEFVKLGAPEWSKTVLQLSSSPVEPLHKISPDVTKHAIAFLV